MAAGKFSRRAFGKTAGAAALIGSVGAPILRGQARGAGAPRSNYYQFPEGFLWGSATASYQVEGAVRADGRGESIWDVFSHTPGKVFGGQTGDVANDDYNRYKQDIQLMKDLGAKACRFSISWSRIFPDGDGQPNAKGMDHYVQVVEELNRQGIEPFCTLFHWDLPESLQKRFGGWESRKTAEAFATYAGHVAEKLSHGCKHFFTMNEFSSFIDIGYKEGRFAPGLKLDAKRLNQTRHNAILAHGLGVQAIRAHAQAGTKVGLAENFLVGVPVYDSPEHIKAAQEATRQMNAMYLTAILEGKYTPEYLKEQGANAPKFTDEDMKAIGSQLDFVGNNVYTPNWVRADESKKGWALIPNPKSYPHMASPWLFIGPQALYWGPRHLGEMWNVPEIYITENGTSSDDVVTSDNQIWDTDRIMFLKNYLVQLHRAVSEGFPVRGYFLWSLMDNFEWADGYSKRFGLYYVDFKTQKRLPKASAHFYKATIAQNALA